MRSGARPECGRHPGSRVQFFGRYGAPGRERQRFRCFPVGGPVHTFTEALPRQVAGHADCVECERSVAAHEGLQAPRCYRFPAREIARTLVALGQGQTYRKAAERARGRLAGGGESRHGQLAADWVEVFAPFEFSGGEPFMEFALMRELVSYVRDRRIVGWAPHRARASPARRPAVWRQRFQGSRTHPRRL